MKYRMKTLLIVFIHEMLLAIAFPATAQAITQLTIVGDDSSPGIIGTYSTTSMFSWMSHVFAGNASGFSWALAPGTDGGVLFNQAQAPRRMMSVRPMFNQPTTFFSVGSGLAIDNSGVIDMANLRLKHSSTIFDLGTGSGFDTFVPRVSDVSLLLPGANGWMLNPNGSYYLIYNTHGVCDGCNLALHLYGVAQVPIPSALMLFFSGALLFGKLGSRRT